MLHSSGMRCLQSTPASLPPFPNPTSIQRSSTSRRPVALRAPSRVHALLTLSPEKHDFSEGVAKSSVFVESEYADLNLREKNIGHVRIRQHVNPLSTALSVPAEPPDWKAVFTDPTLPLMVDIGCGSGRFLLWLAKKFPETKNFLGLEIRKKLVKRAELWVAELSLRNIYFMFANATVSFERLVTSYPGPLVLVSILCPDPYFKNRHHKRRVLQLPLLDSISKNLIPGGKVFIQSDVRGLAMDMRNQFDALSDIFVHIDCDELCDSEGWLLSNPMGIRTEREIHAQLDGSKIYRRLYKRTESSFLS